MRSIVFGLILNVILVYRHHIILMQKAAPVAITWQKLTAVAKQKTILHQNDGYCKSGQMLAIMGASGAGKTTLLSLISQRSNQGLKISGEIRANGFSYNSKSFYQFGTFVYQNDLLMETLTVRQTLEFSAFLKIRDKQEALRMVQQLLANFQLQKCQDTYVGGLFLKGISGGQKKRLCIAIQMVAKPSVIILDEPTSGLDSNKAARVLGILKKFANNGHTIIFTIHQPSYLQYIKLDRLLLLNHGQVIYQGQANKVYAYLQNLDIKVNSSSSISDFFIMQISEYKRISEDYITPFNNQSYTVNLLPKIQEEISEIIKMRGDIEHISFFTETFLYMFKLLSIRNFKCYWRNFMRFGTNLITACLRIVFVGFLFMNWIPERSVIDQQPFLWFPKILGLTFLSTTASFLAPMFQVSLSIPIQRQLYYKQVDSKKYNPFPYFISKVLIELVSALVGTSLYTFVGYWFNGYNSSFINFLGFYLVLVLMTIFGNSIGFFCGALFRQVNRVSALTPIIMIPLLVVSGIFNNLNDIPPYISWLQYLSPFRYGSQMLMENQFGDQKFFHGLYDYKAEFAINCSFGQNLIIVLGLTLGFYISSYLLLLKFTKSIVS